MREIMSSSQQSEKKGRPNLRRAYGSRYLVLIALLVVFDGGCRKSSEEPFFSSHPGSSQPASSPAAAPSSSFGAGFMLSNAPVQVGHPVKLSDLSDSEIHFGIAPKRGPGVTYQDDIILMEQGDKAIQSYGSDGLTWTLDANAPQVSDIQVGKVLFATDRCAGKVLAVQHNGGSVQVVLGPVLLNELVKEGNFAYDQPLDLDNAIAVVAPDYAGALGSKGMNDAMQKPDQASRNEKPHSFHQDVSYYAVSDHGKWTPMRTVTPGGVALHSAEYHPKPASLKHTAFQIPNIPGNIPGNLPGNLPGLGGTTAPYPLPFPKLKQLDFNNLTATPCAFDCGGIGAKIYQEKDGVKVWITIVFHLNNPHLVFGASVGNGGVNANVQLFGGVGVTVTVDANTGSDFTNIKGNIKELGIIPAEINVPIGGLFVPLTAKLSQALDITSGFSAKTSVLHGEGSLDLDGEISATYRTGKGWDIPKPKATVKNSLAGTISGVSVGINSFIFAFTQRLMVGVGTMGFAAGPYVDLQTLLTILKQSSTTWVDCRQATFSITVGAGIGYSMPKIVASVINTILGFFGAKPIPSWGSIVALPKRVEIVSLRDMIPDKCAGGGS